MTTFRSHDFQLSTQTYEKNCLPLMRWKPCHAANKMQQHSREMATAEPGFLWMTQMSRLFGAFWVGPGRTKTDERAKSRCHGLRACFFGDFPRSHVDCGEHGTSDLEPEPHSGQRGMQLRPQLCKGISSHPTSRTPQEVLGSDTS